MNNYARQKLQKIKENAILEKVKSADRGLYTTTMTTMPAKRRRRHWPAVHVGIRLH